MPEMKAVRRINGGYVETTSTIAISNDELLGIDPLTQFAVEIYTVDQFVLNAGPPWWADDTDFRKPTAIEEANFSIAQATDNDLLSKYRAKENMDTDKQLRAIVDVLVDEVNTLRKRTRDNAQDVADATDFSDLKTRWASQSTLDDMTKSQAITLVKNAIDNE